MEYLHGGDIYTDNKIRLDFSVNTNPFGMPEAVKKLPPLRSKAGSGIPTACPGPSGSLWQNITGTGLSRSI